MNTLEKFQKNLNKAFKKLTKGYDKNVFIPMVIGNHGYLPTPVIGVGGFTSHEHEECTLLNPAAKAEYKYLVTRLMNSVYRFEVDPLDIANSKDLDKLATDLLQQAIANMFDYMGITEITPVIGNNRISFAGCFVTNRSQNDDTRDMYEIRLISDAQALNNCEQCTEEELKEIKTKLGI